ncbi:hypothetical protein [Spirosoma validum]|uniref:Uncharacterized protein n=1 Tax=Spirosoma validum TaxID=2771355 RepID=A0A927AZD6_9BACT|nr:hypothetical protein [Spirosoma validum]MBD2752676.1 hypothetical protein [Spirosoma validum]
MVTQPPFVLHRWKWLIACLVVLLIYLLIIVAYAENIPYADDLAVLSSLYDIQHAPNWYLKLRILFNFHNEHRIAIPRLIAIGIYYIQHRHINIMWWIIIGNISIFLLLYLYFKAGFINQRVKRFLPVLFFVLQPMHCELMYWGMASLQNIGVIVLSSLSFYYLFQSKNNYLALLVAVLAVFTSANGLFTFIVGIALLIYRKDWPSSIIWLVIGLLSGFLYWNGFIIGKYSGDGFGESLELVRFLITFISLTGGVVYTQSFPLFSFALGFILLLFISISVYYIINSQSVNSDSSKLFFVACLAFVLLTIAAISLGRHPSNILSGSRYKLYPALVLALTYILLEDRVKENQYIFKSILSFSMLFWVVSYAHYTTRFSTHSRLLFAHFYNWKYSGILDVPSRYSEKYYSERWHKFYQDGQYIPPQKIIEKCQKIVAKVNEQAIFKTSYYFNNKDINIDPVELPIHEYYAVHKAEQKTTIYPLITNNFYKSILTPSKVKYSASINSSYWVKSAEESLLIIPMD